MAPQKIRGVWTWQILKFSYDTEDYPVMGKVVATDILSAAKKAWLQWPELKPSEKYKMGRALPRPIPNILQEDWQ